MRIINIDIRRKSLMLLFTVVSLTVLMIHNLCSAAEPLDVYVVNYPLKYFCERIGGKHVRVSLPAPTDVDPAYWTPDIDTVADFQKADLILLNGAGYSQWVKKVSLPRSKVVDTSKRFKDRYITVEGIVTHSHGPGGEHAHGKTAFTTWLDFQLAVLHAEAIAESLARKLPQHQKELGQNLASLRRDLMALDDAVRDISSRNPGQPLIGSHPVYDYLARGYALNMKSVHWEPDELPTDRHWMELQEILIQHPAKWMVWEGEPIQTSVDKLRTHGVGSLTFDPCANVPDIGDFLTVMRQNIDNLRTAYPLR